MKIMYHRFIYMPDHIRNIPVTKISNLEFTSHAMKELENDDLQFFSDIEFSGKNIIEVTVTDEKITDYVLQFDYDDDHYKIVVISLSKKFRYPTVITVYLFYKTHEMNIINKSMGSKAHLYYRPSNLSFEFENRNK